MGTTKCKGDLLKEKKIKIGKSFEALNKFLLSETKTETKNITILKNCVANYSIANWICFAEAKKLFGVDPKRRYYETPLVEIIHDWFKKLVKVFKQYEEERKNRQPRLF